MLAFDAVMRLFQVVVSVGLAGLMALLPGGSAACWPLPDGRHMHLGWVDAHGQGAAHLHLVAHENRFFADMAGGTTSLGLARVGGTAPPLPMLPVGGWWVLVFMATELWLWPTQPTLGNRAWQNSPPTPPPRWARLAPSVAVCWGQPPTVAVGNR